MTDPRETLARIRRRADAATEGPWEVKPYKGLAEDGDYVDSIVGSSQESIVYQLGCGCCDIGLEVAHPDAEFIAAARTDVPALLDALEKVLRLHPRVVVLHADPEFGRMEDDAICGACIVNHEAADWPCPNVRAITTALNGDAA